MRLWSILALVVPFGDAFAQERVRLVETFPTGYQYRVSCRVDIKGTLTLPPDKDRKGPDSLPLTGTSAIDYDERILPVLSAHPGDRTLRVYRRMDFQRKVGEQNQEMSLRPEARRLVLLRHKQFEVPFSPDGPLLWNEIDLVRTDVFTPALANLLPEGEVKSGDVWFAREPALRELTDLEKLDGAKLTCTFQTVTTLVGRRLARVKFEGWVQGVGEDGPARHQLDGYYLFDLESRHLTYLFVKGNHSLLDKDGKAQGNIEGTFVLTRQPTEGLRELSDEAVRGLSLEPSEANTRLLMDLPDLGVRFLYPRRWRVASVNGTQIALDESRGGGLLISLADPAKTPTGAQFLTEARTWLNGKKAGIHAQTPPQALSGAPHLEFFHLDVDLDKQRVWLNYYVARFAAGGATFVARLTGPDQIVLRQDVERIVRSFSVGPKK